MKAAQQPLNKTKQKGTGYLLHSLKKYTYDILSISDGVNHEQTLEDIKKDLTFRGPSAWILIFSIFIASIGLNANSTAVIIGAMLISPLMGPILGIGTAVAIQDIEMLTRALKNLGIAVTISLLTSTLYFSITPLDLEQSELLARTKPTILDVLVAIFGGFAGIIASSRREKTNVVPGVAIATALMPPLCTAGFGIATGRYMYFFGAFYLFFINSVFISLATFIVVKYLKFPVKQIIDVNKYHRYRVFLLSFLIVTVIPSGVIFFNVIQETRFKITVDQFIHETTAFPNSELITSKVSYSDSLSIIDLYYMGDEITGEQITYLNDRLTNYALDNNDSRWFPLTHKTVVQVHQQKGNSIDLDETFSEYNDKLHINILEDLYKKNEDVIKSKEQKIKLLEAQIVDMNRQLSKVSSDTIPVTQIIQEVKLQYPKIQSVGFSEGESFNLVKGTKGDHVTTVFMYMKSGYPYKQRKEYAKSLEQWLRVRLNDPKLNVIEYR
ncbi:DUF389 domain-containing protein [Sediminitomix flava]|uniref:Putative hydrophobic protein (TIGR00341 family) n=1 Tax=Sediminitomix flava TaxID=379075 RepID=A0A315ZEB9_SEDFL|nr:DUF389 domain-containing protein [Sediminitomix flava]PWJ43682.1 putative hydrophobic protein (TIGR00341 family) [Sediminitomix flava]